MNSQSGQSAHAGEDADARRAANRRAGRKPMSRPVSVNTISVDGDERRPHHAGLLERLGVLLRVDSGSAG